MIMSNVELFDKRWEYIEKVALSSVRRQLKMHSFDLSEVNHDLQKVCNEWFNGNLAPSIWYDDFAQNKPEKAEAFKNYTKGINLNIVERAKPNSLWAYCVTALSLPITYFGIGYITDWELLGKVVCTIGTGVLVWSSCQVKATSLKNEYEEQIVALYHAQLKEHGEKLRHIIL